MGNRQADTISTGRDVRRVTGGFQARPDWLRLRSRLPQGTTVTVYERDDRLGRSAPLQRSQNYKLEKSTLQISGWRGMRAEVHPVRHRLLKSALSFSAEVAQTGRRRGGAEPSVRCAAGTTLTWKAATCTYIWRWNILVPGRQECEGDGPSPISAAGRSVVIIGGGDAGADCLGTAPARRRRSANSTWPQPPGLRDDSVSPWPDVAAGAADLPAHAEGGHRHYGSPFSGSWAAGTATCRPWRSRGQVTRDQDRAAPSRRSVSRCRSRATWRLLAIGFDWCRTHAAAGWWAWELQPAWRAGVRIGLADDRGGVPSAMVTTPTARLALVILERSRRGAQCSTRRRCFLMGESDLPAPANCGRRRCRWRSYR